MPAGHPSEAAAGEGLADAEGAVERHTLVAGQKRTVRDADVGVSWMVTISDVPGVLPSSSGVAHRRAGSRAESVHTGTGNGGICPLEAQAWLDEARQN